MSLENSPNFVLNLLECDVKGADKYFYKFKSFRLDVEERQLLHHNSPVPLTPKAFDVLAFLVERSGHLVDKDELLESVWANSFVEEQNITRIVHTLRKILGEDENGNKFIETVAKKGYRFVAKVTEVPFGDAVGDAETGRRGDTETVVEKSPRLPVASSPRRFVSPSPRLILFAIGFMSAVSLLLLLSFNFLPSSVNQNNVKSIAVMPFINESGDADIEYLSDGMTEALIGSLSQLPNLNVKARSTVFRYKGKEINPQIIGKELNVQAIITGHVVQRGEQLTLSLELIDAQTENVIWSESYNRKSADLLSLQSEIARDVSNKLRVKLSGADEKKLAKNYTASPEAYQLYLRGNFHVEKRTEKEIRKGIEYLEQAVVIDPNYALAYTGLASAYVALPNYSKVQWSEVMPKVKDATLKALSLDNDLPEAHTMLGLIMTTNGDDAGAEREYQRAIELNPNSAMAYHFYSNLFRLQGKLEEAVDKQRRAVELEPLSLIINREYGSKLFFARRYDEAVAQFKKTIELDAAFPSAHYGLALVYWMKGNYPEAVEEHAKHQELNGEPNKAALLRESFAKGGWQGFLRTITDESQQIDLSWDNLTTYYAALGEKDKAFELLNKRFENRKMRPGALIDPRLDPLRDDPRFDELVRRVGLK